ncbi:Protein CHLOROPLAST IMPORT APPARATUS 2, partial [Linum perenne]
GVTEDESGNVWRVLEMEGEGTGEGGSNSNVKEGYCWKQREASVLRYKEKRQNRLFSKRIRYQVRKLNAEKRPRLKGRFVKRIGE